MGLVQGADRIYVAVPVNGKSFKVPVDCGGRLSVTSRKGEERET